MVRLQIVPLDPKLHDRGSFSCGNDRVDAYLKSTAAAAAKYFKSSTFVLVRTDDAVPILGFYTLAQHSYRDEELDDRTARALKVHALKEIPMILLAQLGIATHFQGKGLGKLLLKDVLIRSLSVAAEISGVAIVTDPYNRDAQSFYAKFGFKTLHEEPFVRMILPMRTIALALSGAVKRPPGA